MSANAIKNDLFGERTGLEEPIQLDKNSGKSETLFKREKYLPMSNVNEDFELPTLTTNYESNTTKEKSAAQKQFKKDKIKQLSDGPCLFCLKESTQFKKYGFNFCKDCRAWMKKNCLRKTRLSKKDSILKMKIAEQAGCFNSEKTPWIKPKVKIE